MKPLRLNETYSRLDVHSIFSPDTQFTPQAGTWGLHGIVKIPDRGDDFVFFVTYGQSQGDHEFDEGIENGVLSWQSQPRQGFDNPVIQQLINHNELIDNIYLFLRKDRYSEYEYLGRLKYLTHDNTREKPVYFQWQLIDQGDHVESKTEVSEAQEEIQGHHKARELVLTEKTPSRRKQGTNKETFRARKAPDYAAQDARNRKLGLVGELLALEYEKDRLISIGRTDLVELVVHTSVVEGDGAGYDIKSFNADGSVRYIEVKATRGDINTDFYMSPNEIKFSQTHAKHFYLYRIFDLNSENDYGEFYILEGDILNLCDAQPIGFRLNMK